MNIGIVVHSQTGNTHLVAMKLRDRLCAAGHSVSIERLRVTGEGGATIESFPDLKPYDALVFGAPVQAFSLSLPMRKYMESVKKGKANRVALLITQHFPYPWLGGNRAARQLRKAAEAKGFEVTATAIVHWSKRDRELHILAAVDKLASCFAGRKKA